MWCMEAGVVVLKQDEICSLWSSQCQTFSTSWMNIWLHGQTILEHSSDNNILLHMVGLFGKSREYFALHSLHSPLGRTSYTSEIQTHSGQLWHRNDVKPRK